MDFQVERQRLVEQDLRRLGIHDEAVLNAMASVPREEFVPGELLKSAYRNSALPIGFGQTISQPFVVAEMAELLQLSPADRILEIGTGSGYAAAVLSRIVKVVFTVERIRELFESALVRLRRLGYDNVHLHFGDGTLGWPEKAPYDAIAVAAASPTIPTVLLQQLRIGGRLVIPVGETGDSQQLIRAVRRGLDQFEYEERGEVRFVPLIRDLEQ